MASLQIIVVICAVLGITLARPQGQVAPPQQYQLRPQEPGMPYNFQWSVKDDQYKNDYGHQESSDGRVVSGSYRVALPDGRIQNVSYRVEGDSGYIAKVQYEGQARFDAPAPPQQQAHHQVQPQQNPPQAPPQVLRYNQAGR